VRCIVSDIPAVLPGEISTFLRNHGRSVGIYYRGARPQESNILVRLAVDHGRTVGKWLLPREHETDVVKLVSRHPEVEGYRVLDENVEVEIGRPGSFGT
jgi:hypothetical protein